MSEVERYDCELIVIDIGHGETSETTSMVNAEDYDALRVEVENQRRLKMLVAEKLQNALDNCSAYRAQLAERDKLLGSAKSALCHLLHNIKSAGSASTWAWPKTQPTP